MTDLPDVYVETAKEIAKQLPIKEAYQDAVAPAAKQTAQLAVDLVKTIQLALAPIQLAGALHHQYAPFFTVAVSPVVSVTVKL